MQCVLDLQQEYWKYWPELI